MASQKTNKNCEKMQIFFSFKVHHSFFKTTLQSKSFHFNYTQNRLFYSFGFPPKWIFFDQSLN